MTGAELREIMQSLGVKQVAFAALLGSSQCSISHYIRDKIAIPRKIEYKARELVGMPPLPPLPPIMSGKEFRELRQAARLNQIQLAEKLGRTNYYVSRVECGCIKVSPETSEKMRKLFGYLMAAPQPRAQRNPLPFCGACLCWIGTTGLPCGCPGGRPGINGVEKNSTTGLTV